MELTRFHRANPINCGSEQKYSWIFKPDNVLAMVDFPYETNY